MGVLEDPLQVSGCEHIFCHLCLQGWMIQESVCPIDRQMVTPAQLQPVPRILRNLLSRLEITGSNASRGCKAVVKLASVAFHWKECKFRGSQGSTSDLPQEAVDSEPVIPHESSINVYIALSQRIMQILEQCDETQEKLRGRCSSPDTSDVNPHVVPQNVTEFLERRTSLVRDIEHREEPHSNSSIN
jgi:hypothetical protein